MEYDLLSGQFLNVQLGPGKNNDKTYGTICLGTVEKGDLCLRDLGYFDLGDLQAIHVKEAYFISRLKLNTRIYIKNPHPEFFNNGIIKKLSRRSLEKLCQEFAQILGGEGMLTDQDVCLVQKFRDIDFTIEGVPTRSPLVNPQFFTFEIRGGKVLNLGETVLLQEEVNPLLTELRRRNITVTAVHNHWLFEEPRAMYMHFQSTDDSPLVFARKVRDAFRVLKN